MIFLFVTSITLSFGLWFGMLRPYCRRHGKGFTPGANVGVTLMVDWQEAGELAKARGDRSISWICRLMLGLWLLNGILFVITLAGAVAEPPR